MSYVYAGYAVTFVGMALYAGRVALRGRALRRALGPSAGRGSAATGRPPGPGAKP